MALKCYDCGNIFDESECESWIEPHGEMLNGCPLCKGSYGETKKCKICGGEFLEEELYGDDVCNGCIEEYSKDFDTCYKISNTAKEEIKINALLVSLYSVSDIEKILYHYTKCADFVDCSVFIEQDKHWFADKLVEEVKKNENTKKK